MEKKSYLNKALNLINGTLDIAMILCLTAIPIITIVGLILNYGFIWGSVIGLIILGVILASMWVIKYFISEIVGEKIN